MVCPLPSSQSNAFLGKLYSRSATAPKLRSPLKLLVCWPISHLDVSNIFPATLSVTQRAGSSKARASVPLGTPGCSTASRDFLMWVLLLREDADQGAESVALLGNADSTLRSGFTDALYWICTVSRWKSWHSSQLKYKRFTFIQESEK